MGMTSLLEIRGLHVGFKIFDGLLKVLAGVELAIGEGERVGLVGETGCGKTTTVKSVLRVLPIPPARLDGGEILYRAQDILKMKPREVRHLRRTELTAIFQDPLQALNPVFTVGTQLRDIVLDSLAAAGQRLTRKEITARCVQALAETGMPDPERIMSNYPIQLSGGMRQRVCIAEALIKSAKLLLADEPTTNLDVTIQDQILRKLDELVEEKGMSVLMITHSLGVVMDLTERVYIMYAGTIVEEGRTEELFARPLHPYTQGLMKSVPKLTGEGISKGIAGRIPNYLEPPSGCRFHPRCEHAMPICEEERPPLFSTGVNRRVACFLYQRS
ncbi:MAG: ABC transporter ATP-binding protein [Candidatus Acetothermia bacterium]|jgi:peptide/nickel transport system ATP-binding protein|nr:ABC transporter ATP-binding protein [Candidatus Acetothermia bacterium]MDH7505456.1 ABC transporter ATP-binding protein [Candidatus Acetothermia bacterium]